MAFVKILSVSQEGQFHDCPFRWKLERKDKIPRLVTPQQMFGRSAHSVLESFNRAFRSGVELPMDFLMYIFRQAMGPMHTNYWEYRARCLTGFYVDRIAAEFPPMLVEEQFYLDLLPGYLVTGVIDLITRDMRILDYKFVTKLYPPEDRMQEACYYEGMRKVLDVEPDSHMTLSFLRDEDPAHAIGKPYRVTQNDIDTFWQRMLTFARGVENGTYPKHPKSRWCHPLWCSYYDSHCDHTVCATDSVMYEDIYPPPPKKRRKKRSAGTVG
jgi:hypothetical protein